MQHEISCEWNGKMQFDGNVNGYHVSLDASHPDGTPPNGASPKRLLLLAAAGCTGMDVVPMLEKMQVKLEHLSLDVIADVEEGEPYAYTSMKITYTFKGKDLEASRDKIERAVSLSQEKYCGVAAMLRKAMPITTEIRINT